MLDMKQKYFIKKTQNVDIKKKVEYDLSALINPFKILQEEGPEIYAVTKTHGEANNIVLA